MESKLRFLLVEITLHAPLRPKGRGAGDESGGAEARLGGGGREREAEVRERREEVSGRKRRRQVI